jgi:hypothetical protein
VQSGDLHGHQLARRRPGENCHLIQIRGIEEPEMAAHVHGLKLYPEAAGFPR